ncbi:P-loop NTPase fold protein [Pseudoalteromonas espejiana]
MSAAMEAMTTQAFKEHSDYKNGVKELKGIIKELVKYSIEKPKGGLLAATRSYPAFIFIDELDRCRPTYAVEMLEAIKHIFDIEGLVIVVSTHTEELQHTIKALYGNDFNADNYLRRFFDTKYHLDVGISASLLEANCDFTVLDNNYLEQKSILLFPLLSQGDDIKRQLSSLIAEISNWQSLAPRSAIQLADRLLTSIELIGEEKTVDVLVLLILLCLYMFNKPQYDYMCSIFNDQQFDINQRATDLSLSSKQLNLSKHLKEMIISAKKLSSIKQLLILDEREKQNLMRFELDFSGTRLLTYLQRFQNVLNRNGDIRRSGYMHTFGYDGRGAISESQLLEAHMTFFGVDRFTENDYLNLIGLTSKFADS